MLNDSILPILNALPSSADQGLNGMAMFSGTDQTNPLFYSQSTGKFLTVSDSLRQLSGRNDSTVRKLNDLAAQVAALQTKLATTSQSDVLASIQSFSDTVQRLNSQLSQVVAANSAQSETQAKWQTGVPEHGCGGRPQHEHRHGHLVDAIRRHELHLRGIGRVSRRRALHQQLLEVLGRRLHRRDRREPGFCRPTRWHGPRHCQGSVGVILHRRRKKADRVRRRSSIIRAARKKRNGKKSDLEQIVKDWLIADGIPHKDEYRVSRCHADYVLPDTNTLVEVNGCYWHGHSCQEKAGKFTPTMKRARARPAPLRLLRRPRLHPLDPVGLRAVRAPAHLAPQAAPRRRKNR